MKNPLIAPLLLALAVPVTSVSLAQTPPDAGALQQQIERERQQQLPRRITPDKPATPAALPPMAGIVVTVKQFRFAGNTLLSAEQLAPAVAPFLDRPLDYNQLQAAAAAVAETYRAAGWVVRAYLPQQDIKDGIVTLQIVEAVFGGVKFEGRAARVASEQLLRNVSAQQAGGAPLNADALDRALLLADDLPGVTVAGSLAAGAAEGQTDLILKIADEPPLTGEAGIDTTGSRSTGNQRFTANLNANSPFGLGDLLTSNLIHTRGSDYGRLGYSVPVGNDGWRIGASASDLRYTLIQAPYNSNTDWGTSRSIGLDASYPIIRSRLQNLYLNLNYDHKSFDNLLGAAAGGIASRYKIKAWSAAINGNLFDNFGGGGANSANLTLTSGEREAGISTTEQNFTKLRYSLSRQQVVTNDLSFYAVLAGQQADKNLDSSERFYLGGTSGVRAYPASEAGGSSAYLTNLELRLKLPEGLVLTGFVDSGAVRNYENSGNNYSLSGAGIALAWQSPVGANLKATWASRIGGNPYPADATESLKSSRLWLSATLPF
jgi:hemolysin activation/secretion protein